MEIITSLDAELKNKYRLLKIERAKLGEAKLNSKKGR